MITRIWHGRTKKEDAEKYLQYVIGTGIKDYLDSKGNLDTQIWRSTEGEISHIFTVTQWDDIESIKKFAGEEFNKAKYYPEDEKYLLELEREVKHYETISFSNKLVKKYILLLTDLFEGDNWTDSNFSKRLNSINEEIAFKQPFPGKHSVAEILWHCIYWRMVVLKRSQNDIKFEEQTEKEQNFLSPELLRKKGWSKLVSELNETQENLINFLNSKTDDFLEKEYKPGRKIKYEIEGLIHHDYYHLGQMGLVISILHGQGEKI
ncbi:MAG TPA: DinB family protein [Ignavibacteriaceae bacterium]|nr:DinB family protein [Ignavibacteriaceae bacterium]